MFVLSETKYTKNLHIKQYNQSELANSTMGLDWTLAINGETADSMASIIDEYAGETNEKLKELTNSCVKEIKINGTVINKINNSADIKIPTKLSDLTNDINIGNHDHSYLKNNQHIVLMPDASGTLALKSDLPVKLPADGGNSDTVDNKHANEFVQMPKNGLSITDLNNANYPEAYRSEVSESDSISLGLPSGVWAIDYYRHLDNNGYGFQVAFPLTNSNQNLPRWRSSVGTTWNNWIEMGNGKANGGNSDSVDGVHFYPKTSTPVETNPTPYIYCFNAGDDENCYVKNVYDLTVKKASNSDNCCGVPASTVYIGSVHIPTCGNGQPLEISEAIDFHKSVGDTNDYLARMQVDTVNGGFVWYDTINSAYSMNVPYEIQNLKNFVVNGKQEVISAINDRLGYDSGLNTNHTHADYAYWIRNMIPSSKNLNIENPVNLTDLWATNPLYSGILSVIINRTIDSTYGNFHLYYSKTSNTPQTARVNVTCLSGTISWIDICNLVKTTLNTGQTKELFLSENGLCLLFYCQKNASYKITPISNNCDDISLDVVVL